MPLLSGKGTAAKRSRQTFCCAECPLPELVGRRMAQATPSWPVFIDAVETLARCWNRRSGPELGGIILGLCPRPLSAACPKPWLPARRACGCDRPAHSRQALCRAVLTFDASRCNDLAADAAAFDDAPWAAFRAGSIWSARVSASFMASRDCRKGLCSSDFFRLSGARFRSQGRLARCSVSALNRSRLAQFLLLLGVERNAAL